MGLPDLEGHIKDDIEREGTKISEMTRRVKQAYQDIVSFSPPCVFPARAETVHLQTSAPAVQDDMMFAEDGEMLLE